MFIALWKSLCYLRSLHQETLTAIDSWETYSRRYTPICRLVSEIYCDVGYFVGDTRAAASAALRDRAFSWARAWRCERYSASGPSHARSAWLSTIASGRSPRRTTAPNPRIVPRTYVRHR